MTEVFSQNKNSALNVSDRNQHILNRSAKEGLLQQSTQGQQKSIRNYPGNYKHDTTNNYPLKLSDDVDLELYSSPKKGVTPMTGVLAKIASRESFGEAAFPNKKAKDTPKQRNFRSNRYYKPVKKIKSSSRIGSLKRARESINNALSTNSSKNSKRYGSVPKHILNNNTNVKE